MTGYGRSKTNRYNPSEPVWVVEVRAVNHRALDVKIRSPEPDAFSDMEISRLIRTSIERGSVTVTITAHDEASTGHTINLPRIRQTQAALDELRRELGLPSPVDLATVAAFLSLEGRSSIALHGEALWSALKPAVELALQGLLETRQREGRALRVDMVGRLDRLAASVGAIQETLEPLPERYARRLTEKLAALRELPGFEPGRVAQEVALLADRLDVSEEIVRLRTHLVHLALLMDSEDSVGRKLDFVVQEVGREINTVGSKAQDAHVAALVIEAKSELEKIREQAQNIE